MRFLFSLTIALLFTQAASAQLRIVGESKVPRDKRISLSVEGVPDGAALIWDVSDEEKYDCKEYGRYLEAAAPPGVYRIKVRAITVVGGVAKVETARHTVTVTQSGPLPPPDPDPDPDPKPDPIPEPIAKAWLVVIEETADAAASRGAYITDKGLVDYMKSKGWKHRIADKDAKNKDGERPRDLVPYLERSTKWGLPYVCLVDQKGQVRMEGKLPATPSALLQKLKEIGK